MEIVREEESEDQKLKDIVGTKKEEADIILLDWSEVKQIRKIILIFKVKCIPKRYFEKNKSTNFFYKKNNRNKIFSCYVIIFVTHIRQSDNYLIK